jgi:hypothetical protein
MNIYAGRFLSPSSYTAPVKSLPVTNLNYERAYIHFRPTSTASQYIVIEGASGNFSSGIAVDDFIVMDSITASRPNLSVKRLWTASSNKCDLSPDTLYMEIANNGFFPYKDPAITVRINDQNTPETLTGTVLPDTSAVFKLTTRLGYPTWGENSAEVTLTIPDNRAETDLSMSVTGAKYQAVEPPYATTFQEAEILPWNNLPVVLGFDYWEFGGTGSETYAFFENGPIRNRPGVLVSGCISVKANEPYLVTYRYRALSQLYAENLQVQREKTDGTLESIFAHPAIINTTYESNAVSFVASGTGYERIRFLSNNNLSAREVRINSFSIVEDTARWPGSVALLDLLKPVSGINLSAQEPMSVRISNTGRRPLRNLPIHCMVGLIKFTDTIPSLDPGQTLDFTFKATVNLSEFGTYNVLMFTDDSTLTNGMIEREITNQPTGILIQQPESSLITVFPNPASTEVFIQSDKEFSMLTIHDIRGYLVGEFRVNNTEYRLNTSSFPSGIYLLSVQIGDERISKRVIIQNRLP